MSVRCAAAQAVCPMASIALVFKTRMPSKFDQTSDKNQASNQNLICPVNLIRPLIKSTVNLIRPLIKTGKSALRMSVRCSRKVKFGESEI